MDESACVSDRVHISFPINHLDRQRIQHPSKQPASQRYDLIVLVQRKDQSELVERVVSFDTRRHEGSNTSDYCDR
jgi:hypothetical protein